MKTFTNNPSLLPPGGPTRRQTNVNDISLHLCVFLCFHPQSSCFPPPNPDYCLHPPPKKLGYDFSPLPGTGAASRNLCLRGADIRRARAVKNGVAAVNAFEGAGCVVVGTDVGDAKGIVCDKIRLEVLHP